MLGLTPWRGRVDRATQRGVVALQDGEMVAPPNGAEGGGSGAFGSHGAHRMGKGLRNCPAPPLQVAPRANTYCTAAPLVFNAAPVNKSVSPLAFALSGGQQQFNVFCISSSNTGKNI